MIFSSWISWNSILNILSFSYIFPTCVLGGGGTTLYGHFHIRNLCQFEISTPLRSYNSDCLWEFSQFISSSLAGYLKLYDNWNSVALLSLWNICLILPLRPWALTCLPPAIFERKLSFICVCLYMCVRNNQRNVQNMK